MSARRAFEAAALWAQLRDYEPADTEDVPDAPRLRPCESCGVECRDTLCRDCRSNWQPKWTPWQGNK